MKVEALTQGYLWKDEKQKKPQLQAIETPDNIVDVNENITKEVLQCCDCGKNYKILAKELNFYKKSFLPIPHSCEGCRHKRRMQIRNPRQLWPRKCKKCGINLQSTYAPERPEIVYCETCYLKEVY